MRYALQIMSVSRPCKSSGSCCGFAFNIGLIAREESADVVIIIDDFLRGFFGLPIVVLSDVDFRLLFAFPCDALPLTALSAASTCISSFSSSSSISANEGRFASLDELAPVGSSSSSSSSKAYPSYSSTWSSGLIPV